jgi:tight adherence protein C
VITALLAGAVVGLGVWIVAIGLYPPRPGLAARITDIDARRLGPPPAALGAGAAVGPRDRLGAAASAFAAARGWQLRSVRADLEVVGGRLEDHLARKILLAVGGLLAGPLLAAVFTVAGLRVPLAIPAWLAAAAAAALFIAPDIDLRKQATAARREFRRVVAAYLDWVKSCLEGGRGAPEALPAAAAIGRGWALARIRDALAAAQLAGRTPWSALGQLGDQLGVDELKDLAAALSLAAEDGAKIRATLAARATTLRQRELTELEGAASERSQSMLIAQLPLALGFLLFLLYPAITRVLDIL